MSEKKETLSHDFSLLLGLVELKEVLRKHFFQEGLPKLRVFRCILTSTGTLRERSGVHMQSWDQEVFND